MIFIKEIGANVIELDNPENIDNEIETLYQNNYKTIVITNEVASFSDDLIKKYNTLQNISIIIAPKK